METAFEQALIEAGIPFERNPFNGSDDPRRADFDYIVRDILVEVKSNPAAATTHNVCIEEDILEVSLANLFLIAFPDDYGWHATVLTRLDIESLLATTKMGFNGRVYKYKRVPAGQFGRLSMLVPVSEIMGIGQPVEEFIESLKQ